MFRKMVINATIIVAGILLSLGILKSLETSNFSNFKFNCKASALSESNQGIFSQNDITFYDPTCDSPGGSNGLMADTSFRVDESIDAADFWYAEGCLVNCTSGQYAHTAFDSASSEIPRTDTKTDDDFGGMQYIYAENYDAVLDTWPPHLVKKSDDSSTRKYYWIVLPTEAYSNGFGETYVATFEKLSEPVYFIVYDTQKCQDQKGGYCDKARADPDGVKIGYKSLGAITRDGGNYNGIVEKAGKLTALHRIDGRGEVLAKEVATGNFGSSDSDGTSSGASPTGKNITWIGDSYSVQAYNKGLLEKDFSGLDVGPGSVNTSTSYIQGSKFVFRGNSNNPSCLSILQNIINEQKLRPYLVFACGTNGGWTDGDIAELKNKLSNTKTKTVLVTSKTPNNDYTDSNKRLKQLAKSDSNFAVADWTTVYKADYFNSDSIHPTTDPGYEKWVGVIKNALSKASSKSATNNSTSNDSSQSNSGSDSKANSNSKGIVQAFSINQPALAIADHDEDAGIQIEIVEKDYDELSQYSDEEWDYIASLLVAISDETGIPLTSSVDWSDTSSRLGVDDFRAYEGVLGHMHAPDNDHSDPGDIWKFLEPAIKRVKASSKNKKSTSAKWKDGWLVEGSLPGAVKEDVNNKELSEAAHTEGSYTTNGKPNKILLHLTLGTTSGYEAYPDGNKFPAHFTIDAKGHGDNCNTYAGKYPQYLQSDFNNSDHGPDTEDWTQITYGNAKIPDNGCGVCSIAMLATVATGQDIYPGDIVNLLGDKYYWNVAEPYALDAIVGEKYGFETVNVPVSDKTDTYEKMKKYLKDGYMLHFCGNGTHEGFGSTSVGHYVGIFSIDENDRVQVANSAAIGNSETDLQNLVDAHWHGAFTAIKGKSSAKKNSCTVTEANVCIGGDEDESDSSSNGDVLAAVKEIIELANKQGSTYTWGGGHFTQAAQYEALLQGPINVDCTGFASLVMYKAFGEELSFSSESIFNHPSYEEVDKKDAQPGDIFAYNSPEGHGGIIIEAKDGIVTKIAETGGTEGRSGGNTNIGYSGASSYSVGIINGPNGHIFRYKGD